MAGLTFHFGSFRHAVRWSAKHDALENEVETEQF